MKDSNQLLIQNDKIQKAGTFKIVFKLTDSQGASREVESSITVEKPSSTPAFIQPEEKTEEKEENKTKLFQDENSMFRAKIESLSNRGELIVKFNSESGDQMDFNKFTKDILSLKI